MNEAKRRWNNESWLEEKVFIATSIPSKQEWEPYETYMKALILEKNKDFALLLVCFPPESSEDNQLHTHPISDRRVTVISGSGEFICYRDARIQSYPLFPGSRVWMPKGVLHTFKSGNKGLLVESLHSPFVPFDHPLCLVYPKNQEI